MDQSEPLNPTWDPSLPVHINFLLDPSTPLNCHITVGEGAASERFGVNKWMLIARSKMMALMLWKTNPDNRKEFSIPDIEPATFRQFLVFMYGHDNTRSLLFEESLKLLSVAEEYVVPDLKAKLGRVIMDQISPSNLFYILIYAEVCETLPDLWEKITAVIQSHTEEVFSHPEFCRVRHHVVLHILQQDRLSVPEVEVWRAALNWAKAQAVAVQSQPEQKKVVPPAAKLVQSPVRQPNKMTPQQRAQQKPAGLHQSTSNQVKKLSPKREIQIVSPLQPPPELQMNYGNKAEVTTSEDMPQVAEKSEMKLIVILPSGEEKLINLPKDMPPTYTLQDLLKSIDINLTDHKVTAEISEPAETYQDMEGSEALWENGDNAGCSEPGQILGLHHGDLESGQIDSKCPEQEMQPPVEETLKEADSFSSRKTKADTLTSDNPKKIKICERRRADEPVCLTDNEELLGLHLPEDNFHSDSNSQMSSCDKEPVITDDVMAEMKHSSVREQTPVDMMSPDNLRKTMLPFLKHIRLCTLSFQEFCEEVAPTRILTDSEVIEITVVIGTKQKSEKLKFVNNVIEKREMVAKGLTRLVGESKIISLEYDIDDGPCKSTTSYSLLTKKNNIELIGVTSRTRLNPHVTDTTPEGLTFNLSIMIKLYQSNYENGKVNDYNLVAEIPFDQQVEYDAPILIPFHYNSTTVLLEANTEYTIEFEFSDCNRSLRCWGKNEMKCIKNCDIHFVCTTSVYRNREYHIFNFLQLNYNTVTK